MVHPKTKVREKGGHPLLLVFHLVEKRAILVFFFGHKQTKYSHLTLLTVQFEDMYTIQCKGSY